MSAKKRRAVVLTEDLKTIRRLCKSVGGCWVPPATGPMPCRAVGDDRSIEDLPTFAPHRWVWSVVNGYTLDPGPSVHVRRTCLTKRCCRPDHLHATTSEGVRLSKSEFKHHMKRLASASPPAMVPPSIKREVVVRELTQLKALCKIDKKGCWTPRRSGRVAVRAPGDFREDSELPRQVPHRAAYMIAHGRTRLLQGTEHIRRKCENKRCCNPDHLYLHQVDDSLAEPHCRELSDGNRTLPEKTSKGVLVVTEDLNHIKALCNVSREGCWLPNVSSQCACRANGDTKPADALPRMAIHRWAWLVANGHAGVNFPGNLVHVRRTCSGRLCCNPDHLYLASPDGTKLWADDIFDTRDAGKLANSTETRVGVSETETDDDAYLRSVLMF